MELSISRSQSDFFRVEKMPQGVVEVFDYPSNTSPGESEQYVILLTPGNPGVIQIYEKFLKSLHVAFYKRVRVIGVGHLGHSKRDCNNGKLFTIEDQIEKTVNVMQKLFDASGGKLKFILFGHSLGSFININVIQRHPEFPVIFTFHLFPVWCKLHIPLFLKVISQPIVRKVVSTAISYMPKITKIKTITSMYSYAEQEAELAVNYSTNNCFLENVLFLGDNFVQMTNEEIPCDLLKTAKQQSDRSLFVCTPIDRYVTPKVYEYLTSTLEFAKFIKIPLEKRVDHAFVKNDGYQIVRQICLEELANNKLTSSLFEQFLER